MNFRGFRGKSYVGTPSTLLTIAIILEGIPASEKDGELLSELQERFTTVSERTADFNISKCPSGSMTR